MTLKLNCRNLPPSEAGPGVVVFVWASELDPMESDRWGGRPPTRGSNACAPCQDFVCLVGAAGETGVEHVGQLHGPAAGSLQRNEFHRSGSGTTGRTPCTRRQPNQRGHDCHKLSMGLGRGLDAAQSPPG